MVRRLARLTGPIGAAAGSDIHLASQNRFDAALDRLVVERDGREYVPVFGDGDRRHLQIDRAVEQLAYSTRAVEQRELGVQMQMDETHSHSIVAGGFELTS